jgi:twitching motility protein PilT
MARINSLLSILVDQNANELRLASDREPKMLAFGTPTRLAMPKMDGDTVRSFLTEIVTDEHQDALNASGQVETEYDAGAIGRFRVTLTQQNDGAIAAVFVRVQQKTAAVAPTVALPAQIANESPRFEIAASSAPLTPEIELPTEAPPMLQLLVANAHGRRASDIHLADHDHAFVRVDGRLQPLEGMAPTVEEVIGIDLKLARRRSIETAFDVPRIGRVRVHAYLTANGAAVAIRIVPAHAPTFESLQMPVAFDDVVGLPHGLVIVCGATGSGKSTTLAALAQAAMSKRSVVLVTLEDPIEYALDPAEGSLLRRRQIGRDVADFASGLRDALREDPDVLLVGEMRDPETIGLAITAAETGHLVLASLHSRGAASAIERIVDAHPEESRAQVRVQLAGSLRAIIGQTLLRRARGGGRIPAVEVLRNNHAIAALIRDGRTSQIASAIQAGRREGMIALERSLADRVRAQEVTLDEARAAANDPDSLTAYLTQ